MGFVTAADLLIGTKSIRSRSDVEDYFIQFNAGNICGYTAYYSKDIVVSVSILSFLLDS
jgi:hypothetical protein